MRNGIAKVGDFVQAGEPLLWIHHENKGLAEASNKLLSAYRIKDDPVHATPMIFERVTYEGAEVYNQLTSP